MYVYESENPRSQDEGGVALYLVGSDVERKGYANFISSCLSWAIRMQEVTYEDAASLSKCLQTGAPVGGGDRAAMLRVLDMAQLYGQLGAYGMCVAAVDESVSVTALFEGANTPSSLIDYVLEDGVLAEELDGALEPYVLPLEKLVDHYEEGSAEMHAAVSGEYNSFGWQTEIAHRPGEAQPYQASSDRLHLSLGIMSNGQFEPLLTVLDETHPARRP